MEERGNKTIMSSVLFLDIVEYSKKSVTGQISLKDRFNGYLSAAICNVPVSDRIILDTGDGAAVNFLGDVEDALKAALSLRESISSEDPNVDPPLQVRAGINLGPVRLVRDINGQPNIVGDGINVAQRVMGFAEINQILVSRSYHDAVSRLSPQYAGLFHSQGSRTDKHVREHEVYAVGRPGEKTTELLAATALAEEEAKSSVQTLASAKIAWNSAASKLEGMIGSVVGRFKQADSRQRTPYIGAIAILVILTGVLLLKPARHDKNPVLPDAGQVQAASGTQPVSAVVPVAPVVVVPAVPAAPHAESKPAGTAQPAITAKPDGKKAGDQAKSPALQTRPAKPAEPVRKSTATADTGGGAEHSTEAYIYFICKEEGVQLFVDGAEKGKPQLMGGVVGAVDKSQSIPTGLTVAVSPGKHKVIVTGKGSKFHTQSVELEPGKTAHIKPNFCN
ncbi:MAG: adenylate/guanylate cyclase domain-containing protein [Nitrosomonadales bacterium]|nr:adenylate/guanylate cyclase domain-containing protein [Nitrosomonadales bacterium]